MRIINNALIICKPQHASLYPLLLAFLLGLSMLVVSPLAVAHDLNFGVLKVEVLDDNVYQFDLRYTSQQLDLNTVSYEVPGCENILNKDDATLMMERKLNWTSRCNANVLKAAFPVVSITGLSSRQPILVRLIPKTGGSIEKVFRENPIALVDMLGTSGNEPGSSSTLGYLEIGFEHILIGYDHLLVVLCFLLLFSRLSKILWVVTGFTLGHSLSLVLATSFAWQIPATLVELFILLSVIFMARESFIDSRVSLLHQYPVMMSALIGLLHGLGFANVMNELGLPEENALLAIAFFNLGVELGQLLFVAVSLIVLNVIKRWSPRKELVTKVISLGVGGTSVFWLIQF